MTQPCRVCGTALAPALYPELTHAGCSPVTFFEEPAGESPEAIDLKRRLVEVILDAEAANPRAHQVQLGPSELSDPCDRRLTYRLAGIEPTNRGYDPWYAIVGTAVHAWLESKFRERGADWQAETVLELGAHLGHSDLYHRPTATVIDWKTAGTDMMRKVKQDKIPSKHQVQVHIYGHGYALKGWPVRKVALVYLPRNGALRDMTVWIADYDPAIAEAALARPYQIAQDAMALDVLNQSHRFEQIPASPSDDCGICPWYSPMRTAEEGASAAGCPGR